MPLRFLGGIACVVLMTSAGVAQSTAPGGEKKEVLATGGLVSSLIAAPVVGQPYSAMQVTHSHQKLADGTTISHNGHHFVARDSSGRVRVEMRMAKGANGEPDTVMVFVMDPVAHTLTTWVIGGKGSKVASQWKLPKAGEQAKAPVQQRPVETTNRPQPIVTTEDLGMQTLLGLQVTDVKTTTIVPAGRSGNDSPITKTHEVWTSRDLKLVVKQQWEDPRIGERVVELENFSQAEPDPGLFRVPGGYTVKDALQSLKELEEKLSEAQN